MIPRSSDFWTFEDYKEDLAAYLRQEGPYTENLVSLTLRQIERQFGTEAANRLIDEFDLTRRLQIHKKRVPAQEMKARVRRGG